MNHESRIKWLRWLVGVLLVSCFAVVGVGFWAYRALAAPLNGSTIPISFSVRPGERSGETAANLQATGLIRSSLAIRGYLRLTNKSFKAGIYSLVGNSSSVDNIQPVLQGVVADRQVTIPEGLRLNEVAQLLETNQIISATEFLAAARYRPALVTLPEPYNLKADTFLEGFLFPDTYRFAADATADQIIAKMMDNYLSRTQGLSIDYETLILASIIEREAKFDEDRPLIASVFTNRLAAGMPLQSDVTVVYAKANQLHDCSDSMTNGCATSKLVTASAGWWPPLVAGDTTEIQSAYNTYQQPGLPPRPICNPGLTSIQAAVNPAKTDYRYFIADRTGHAHFATTLAEHNANVVKYLNQ